MSAVDLKTKNIQKWALIVVDMQNDFIGGSMAHLNPQVVIECQRTIPIINRLLKYVKFDLVVYSRDWHPPGHISFVSSEKSNRSEKWPEHCVRKTWGAEYHKDLYINPKEMKTIHVLKGTKQNEECYSAMQGEFKLKKNRTKLADYFQTHSFDSIFVCGMLSEYCVLSTCKEIFELNITKNLYVLVDAVLGLKPFDPKMFYKFSLLTTTDRLIQSVMKFQIKMPLKELKFLQERLRNESD